MHSTAKAWERELEALHQRLGELFTLGCWEEVDHKAFAGRLARDEVRCHDGAPLPRELRERLLRECERLALAQQQGLPISSSIAESAVNQVVSHRMAKKRQMRWTDEGAQIRVAVMNGEFSPRRISALEIAASRHGKCIGAVSPGRHRPTNRTDHATLPQTRAA
jgi:hypothetical protein